MSRVAWTIGLIYLATTSLLRAGQDMPKTNIPSGWADNPSSRQKQAAEWLAEISKIDMQIPTLSPAEMERLKVEYDDERAKGKGITATAWVARNSKAGLCFFAKQSTQNMVSILKQLASSTDLNRATEVALWSKLAYAALDSSTWFDIAKLGDMKVLTRDPSSGLGAMKAEAYSVILSGLWALRVREIIRAIVLPYLGVPMPG